MEENGGTQLLLKKTGERGRSVWARSQFRFSRFGGGDWRFKEGVVCISRREKTLD